MSQSVGTRLSRYLRSCSSRREALSHPECCPHCYWYHLDSMVFNHQAKKHSVCSLFSILQIQHHCIITHRTNKSKVSQPSTSSSAWSVSFKSPVSSSINAAKRTNPSPIKQQRSATKLRERSRMLSNHKYISHKKDMIWNNSSFPMDSQRNSS